MHNGENQELLAAECVHTTNSKKFECQICRKVSRKCYLGILQHIREVHSFEPDFHILCGLDGCPATYNVYESFRSHVYKKHRELLTSNNSCNQGVAAEDTAASDSGGQDTVEASGDNDIDDDSYDEVLVDNIRVAAMFILRTTEIQRTSQVRYLK